MAFAPASPITGAALTGLTTPTYTLTGDTPPAINAKQFAVTTLGGTQTGVLAHSIGSPFTLTAFRPQKFKVLGSPNANGVINSFPRNVFEFLVRKGVSVAVNQPVQLAWARLSIGIPAGNDIYDKVNYLAMMSALIGMLNGNAQQIVDCTVSGNV